MKKIRTWLPRISIIKLASFNLLSTFSYFLKLNHATALGISKVGSPT